MFLLYSLISGINIFNLHFGSVFTINWRDPNLEYDKILSDIPYMVGCMIEFIPHFSFEDEASS